MIELYIGKPGSGKSYYAVTQIVAAVKSGRRVWALMDLAMSDYWVSVTDKNYEEIESLVKIVPDLSFIPDVQSGDLVVIDECQRFMRAGSEPDKALLYFFETHRHHGIDVTLISQDYMKILRQVYILAENVFRFRKMSFLGVNKARVRVCTGVRDDDELRAFWMSYDKKYFTLYKSYFKDGVSEKTNKKMLLWRSPVLIVAGVLLVAVIYVIGFRSWFGGSVAVGSTLPEVSKASTGSKTIHKVEPVIVGSGVPPAVYKISGTVCGDGTCMLSLSDGRMMSPETLVSLVGSGVISSRNGIKYVVAEGVQYVGMGYSSN